MEGDPEVVRVIACPLRPELTAEIVERALKELVAAELVEWYVAEGEQCLAFPSFKTHQTGFKYDREAASRIPAPPGKSGLGQAKVRTRSGSTPDKVLPSEVKLSEVKSVASSEAKTGWPVEGAQFWTEKVGPITPPRMGRALKPVVDAHGWPTTRAALECYIESTEGRARSPQWFANDAVRWLRLGKMPLIDPDTGAFTERGQLAQRSILRPA